MSKKYLEFYESTTPPNTRNHESCSSRWKKHLHPSLNKWHQALLAAASRHESVANYYDEVSVFTVYFKCLIILHLIFVIVCHYITFNFMNLFPKIFVIIFSRYAKRRNCIWRAAQNPFSFTVVGKFVKGGCYLKIHHIKLLHRCSELHDQLRIWMKMDLLPFNKQG